jgi:hypothetical protein
MSHTEKRQSYVDIGVSDEEANLNKIYDRPMGFKRKPTLIVNNLTP